MKTIENLFRFNKKIGKEFHFSILKRLSRKGVGKCILIKNINLLRVFFLGRRHHRQEKRMKRMKLDIPGFGFYHDRSSGDIVELNIGSVVMIDSIQSSLKGAELHVGFGEVIPSVGGGV